MKTAERDRLILLICSNYPRPQSIVLSLCRARSALEEKLAELQTDYNYVQVRLHLLQRQVHSSISSCLAWFLPRFRLAHPLSFLFPFILPEQFSFLCQIISVPDDDNCTWNVLQYKTLGWSGGCFAELWIQWDRSQSPLHWIYFEVDQAGQYPKVAYARYDICSWQSHPDARVEPSVQLCALGLGCFLHVWFQFLHLSVHSYTAHVLESSHLVSLSIFSHEWCSPFISASCLLQHFPKGKKYISLLSEDQTGKTVEEKGRKSQELCVGFWFIGRE